MLRLIALSMSLLLLGAMLTPTALSQDTQPSATRKIVNEVAPAYPALAGKLNLVGTVKLLVTVAPNGTVRSVEVRGGHPVLVPAAQNTIYKWKWVPATEESKELVEMKFRPN